MNKYYFLILVFCTLKTWGQIPQTLVYRDTIPYFFAWKDSVIKQFETGFSSNRMIQVTINNRITHEYLKQGGNSFIGDGNVLSNKDTTQNDVVFGLYGTIFRLSLTTGKVDTVLVYDTYSERYYISSGSKLIGKMKDLSLISYDMNTAKIDTLYQFGEYDENDRLFSIWGVNKHFYEDLFFIVIGQGYELTESYYLFDLRTNTLQELEFNATEEETVNEGISFSHGDITTQFVIMRDYWIDSSYSRIQPTLRRISSPQGFKTNKDDSYYYLYSTIDEPLSRNGLYGVWIPCRFTLPFDLCLYKIYNNQLLSQNEISDFDEWELHKLRNMVFAKHNYKFDSHYLQAFYNRFEFYSYGRQNRTKEVNDKLTAEDHANLRLINSEMNKF